MKEKDFALTAAQREVMEVILKQPLGTTFRTGQIGRFLKMDKRYIANYLGPRLMGLYKRGFLERTKPRNVALWSAGPIVDAMMEAGLLALYQNPRSIAVVWH